jgi:hypothetical protein
MARVGLQRDLRTKVEDDLALTGGTHMSEGERRDKYRFREGKKMGRGLLPLLGRKGSPRLFLFFLFFSSFSFSVFLFLLYLFQIWSKLLQTNL